MAKVRVGAAQVPQTDVLEDNVAHIQRALDEAARRDVQILVFPEAQVPGYRGDIKAYDAPIPDGLDDAHEEIVRRCGELGVACILGTETPHDDPAAKPYNSAWFISERGEVLGKHHKTILTPLDLKSYSEGSGFQVHELYGVPVGAMVCFEGFRFPASTRALVGLGAQIVFHPHNNGSPGLEWKQPIIESLEVARAGENTVWVVGANIAVDYQNARSLVIAPDGRVVASSTLGEVEVLTYDLDPAAATHAFYDYDPVKVLSVIQGDTLRGDQVEEVKSHQAALVE